MLALACPTGTARPSNGRAFPFSESGPIGCRGCAGLRGRLHLLPRQDEPVLRRLENKDAMTNPGLVPVKGAQMKAKSTRSAQTAALMAIRPGSSTTASACSSTGACTRCPRGTSGCATTSRFPDEEYEKYFKRFDPDLYDPKLWAQTASQAGMKYFVVTTKHHEGFCLWDSKLTDYKAPNTPARRDLLRPMVEAFRRENLRVGFYHSLIDWHHPQYVLDPHIGPYRAHADREKMNRGRDQRKYAAYLHGQVQGTAHAVRQGGYHVVRLQLPQARRQRQRARGLAERKTRPTGAKAPAQGRPERSPRPAGGLGHQDRRADPAARNGSRWTASRWCGRPARPSPAPGATTATRVPGAARTS